MSKPGRSRKKSPFATIDDAIAAIGRGEMIIVVDDEDRENEGDLTIAADKITPDAINFMAVPPVLLSGHHAEIEKWRRREALRRTLDRRPDLLSDAQLDEADRRLLHDLLEQRAKE